MEYENRNLREQLQETEQLKQEADQKLENCTREVWVVCFACGIDVCCFSLSTVCRCATCFCLLCLRETITHRCACDVGVDG